MSEKNAGLARSLAFSAAVLPAGFSSNVHRNVKPSVDTALHVEVAAAETVTRSPANTEKLPTAPRGNVSPGGEATPAIAAATVTFGGEKPQSVTWTVSVTGSLLTTPFETTSCTT